MAESRITYTALSNQTIFGVPFPFLSRSHVTITVAAVTATFTFQGDNQITISAPAPVADDAVVIKRTTPRVIDDIVISFIDGSGLPAVDLNTGILQNFYLCQEILDDIEGNNDAAASATAAAASASSAATSATAAAANGVTYSATVSGTNTIVLTPATALGAYTEGQRIRFFAAGANSGAVTVNVSGLGAKAFEKNGGTALSSGDIIGAGAAIEATYDGTKYELVTLQAGTDLASPTSIGSTSANTGTFTTLIGTTIDGIIGSVTPAAATITTLIGTTIDGPIGSVTPAAIIGTTVVANTSLDINSSIVVTGTLDEDDLTSDSNVKLATQQSIKKYVDDNAGSVGTDGVGTLQIKTSETSLAGTVNTSSKVDLTLADYTFWPMIHITSSNDECGVTGHDTDSPGAANARLGLANLSASTNENYDIDYRAISTL